MCPWVHPLNSRSRDLCPISSNVNYVLSIKGGKGWHQGGGGMQAVVEWLLGIGSAYVGAALSALIFGLRLAYINGFVREAKFYKKLRNLGPDVVALGTGAHVTLVVSLASATPKAEPLAIMLLTTLFIFVGVFLWIGLFTFTNPQTTDVIHILERVYSWLKVPGRPDYIKVRFWAGFLLGIIIYISQFLWVLVGRGALT